MLNIDLLEYKDCSKIVEWNRGKELVENYKMHYRRYNTYEQGFSSGWEWTCRKSNS